MSARTRRGEEDGFHVGDWTAVIAQKLRTLDGLYETLKQDRVNRLNLILEGAIVLLFIIDLIILLIGTSGC